MQGGQPVENRKHPFGAFSVLNTALLDLVYLPIKPHKGFLATF